MNKSRRKKLKAAFDYLELAYSMLEEIFEEESEALDNMPENLQGTERYSEIEQNVYDLEESKENLYEITCTLADIAQR